MANVQSLSAAHVILLAIDFSARTDLHSLQSLQRLRPDILLPKLCCRLLLTFIPANQHPDGYLPLLGQLLKLENVTGGKDAVDTSAVEDVSEAEARRQVQEIYLEHLSEPSVGDTGSDAEDVVARFVVQQAHRIDAEIGDLPVALQLVEPLIDTSEYLRRWLISHLLPILRLDYEYYPDAGSRISLEEIDTYGVQQILNSVRQRRERVKSEQNLCRDFRGVVSPFLFGARPSKRRKLSQGLHRGSITGARPSASAASPWEDVNEWMLKTSLQDFELVATTVAEWGGPADFDFGGYEGPSASGDESGDLTTRYYQTAFAILYANDSSSAGSFETSMAIRNRVSKSAATQVPRPKLKDSTLYGDGAGGLRRGALSVEALLDEGHPLTRPSIESLAFLDAILESVHIIKEDLRAVQPLSCRTMADLCLFADSDSQRLHLQKMLGRLSSTDSIKVDWYRIRDRVLWLNTWRDTPVSRFPTYLHAPYGHVSAQNIEIDVFDSTVAAKQYDVAISIYLPKGGSGPLSTDVVGKLVEKQILSIYDNSSNGNRSRGGMKRASELLKAFNRHFSSSRAIIQLEHLIAATHSLSFYHLTLQHGVPFRPASIRVHRDPIALISKVLEQNPDAYTKLDDLLSIGRGLVASGLPLLSPSDYDTSLTTPSDNSLQARILEADRRITYDAIISALSADDFDTAYSYIPTRLFTTPTTSSSPSSPDDTSWRAAYAAGRHRPKPHPIPQNQSPTSQITLLSQRLELLSLALTLVPSPLSLPSMLTTWSTLDTQLSTLRAAEAAATSAWDDSADGLASSSSTHLPGEFAPPDDRERDMDETRREREKRRLAQTQTARNAAVLDEAPMGLFDVARGAARAIGKSAFPLRAEGVGGTTAFTAAGGARGHDLTAGVGDLSPSEAEMAQNRVRKRDMVSNMVTSGFVGGLGWVLGAQPVASQGQEEGGGGIQGGIEAGHQPTHSATVATHEDGPVERQRHEPLQLKDHQALKVQTQAQSIQRPPPPKPDPKAVQKEEARVQDEWEDW